MTTSSEPEKIQNNPSFLESNRLWLFPVLGCAAFAGLCLVSFLLLYAVPFLRTVITQKTAQAPSVVEIPIVEETPTLVETPIPTSTGPVEITWFVGLGTGSDESQRAGQQAVVDDFNASQSSIHLNLEIVPYASALDTFLTNVAAGEGPDLVGPTSLFQTSKIHGQWLDLTPYISPADLEPYNPAVVKMFQSDEGQIALPFAVYPSALFYNTALFDQAGLRYPPANYGEKYEMPDGSQVEWSWDTLADVARLLTIDDNGKDATQPGFDKNHIVEYGYSWNFELHPAYIGSYFQGGSMLADDGRSAQVPDAWHTAWDWTYNGIWGDQPFMANSKVAGEPPFTGNSFNSGRVAMTVQPAWYTCCMNDMKTWDLAAMPSYRGKVGGRIDVDTFFIWKGSKHPKEAYQVMLYLLNDGVRKLMVSYENPSNQPYGGLSARTDQQQAWINFEKRQFPWVMSWDVLIAGLDYPDLPPAESYLPNFENAWKRGTDFSERLFGTPGLDLAAEEQKYLDDLNKLFAGKK